MIQFILFIFLFALGSLQGQNNIHLCDPVITIQAPHSTSLCIPRHLFQTWKTHQLPENFAQWSHTWKTCNPHWEFALWDDEENRKFIEDYYPWFLPHYDAYAKEIFRADAVRYFYLFTFGGVYADLDFECVKSLEPLLDENCVILGRMSSEDHAHNIPNAFMASPPKADFWIVVIHMLLNAPEDLQPEYMTGPVVVRKAVLAYQNRKHRQMILNEMKGYLEGIPIPIQLRPPCELYPYDWTTKRGKVLPCSYAITWWTHSWN